MEKEKKILDFLLERFAIERKKFDRSGVYAFTQRLLAYNSNKIEGSTLTEEQTASLFDSGMLPKAEDYYRAKDVEETNGHFLMFNKMLDTLEEPLAWYHSQKADLAVLAEFHARYESIHPFQDGNGRTGRLILFRECLRHGIVPVVIEDCNRQEYIDGLKEFREEGQCGKLTALFEKEQEVYLEKCGYFFGGV